MWLADGRHARRACWVQSLQQVAAARRGMGSRVPSLNAQLRQPMNSISATLQQQFHFVRTLPMRMQGSGAGRSVDDALQGGGSAAAAWPSGAGLAAAAGPSCVAAPLNAGRVFVAPRLRRVAVGRFDAARTRASAATHGAARAVVSFCASRGGLGDHSFVGGPAEQDGGDGGSRMPRAKEVFRAEVKRRPLGIAQAVCRNAATR